MINQAIVTLKTESGNEGVTPLKAPHADLTDCLKIANLTHSLDV